MKNVSHKKGWVVDTNPDHVERPSIPLIKENSTGKSDVDYVKLKMRRDHTFSTSDLYEFSMSLFDLGEPEELLLFVKNFQINFAATGMLETEVKVQYLCMIFRE